MQCTPDVRLLIERGWIRTGWTINEFDHRERVTWWRSPRTTPWTRAGAEYPQHYAVSVEKDLWAVRAARG